MDRADRIDSSAGTLLRLDLAALHFPPFGPVDAPGRRGGTVYFPSFLFFSGPRRRYPTIVFLLPRAGEASQGFRIEFRMRRTLPTPDLFTVRPAASPRETGLGRNNIDPLKFARRVYKARVGQKRRTRSENGVGNKRFQIFILFREKEAQIYSARLNEINFSENRASSKQRRNGRGLRGKLLYIRVIILARGLRAYLI